MSGTSIIAQIFTSLISYWLTKYQCCSSYNLGDFLRGGGTDKSKAIYPHNIFKVGDNNLQLMACDG